MNQYGTDGAVDVVPDAPAWTVADGPVTTTTPRVASAGHNWPGSAPIPPNAHVPDDTAPTDDDVAEPDPLPAIAKAGVRLELPPLWAVGTIVQLPATVIPPPDVPVPALASVAPPSSPGVPSDAAAAANGVNVNVPGIRGGLERGLTGPVK
jgi:hypothetical protein